MPQMGKVRQSPYQSVGIPIHSIEITSRHPKNDSQGTAVIFDDEPMSNCRSEVHQRRRFCVQNPKSCESERPKGKKSGFGRLGQGKTKGFCVQNPKSCESERPKSKKPGFGRLGQGKTNGFCVQNPKSCKCERPKSKNPGFGRLRRMSNRKNYNCN